MKRIMLFSLLALMLPVLAGSQQTDDGPGWVSLFDGKTLDGWKASQFGDKSFTVQDGAIVANGRSFSHLFYVGKVNEGEFKNFEFKADVLTRPNSNGGIYFHTRFQPTGWPELGFEVQVNNTFHRDRRKTGSLYGLQDVFDPPTKDNEWFAVHILVRADRVVVKVDGETTADWTQQADWKGIHAANLGVAAAAADSILSSGTFALQAHDPNSVVLYKNLRVKPLP